MTPHETPRQPPARPSAAPCNSDTDAAEGKGPVFAHIGGDVFWRPGGAPVLVTPAMADQLIADLTQEAADGALVGDVAHVRRAARLLNELRAALRAARLWRDAGRPE